MVASCYAWDPEFDCITKETDAAGAVTARYTQEPKLYGGLISQHRSGASSFYHYDAIGTTRALTNSSQATTDTVVYTAFGEKVASVGTTANPFGFVGAVGYYANPATDNVYVRARHYRPRLARWLTLDPKSFGTPNLNKDHYLYVVNRSMKYVDPSGLKEQKASLSCPGKCTRSDQCKFVISADVREIDIPAGASPRVTPPYIHPYPGTPGGDPGNPGGGWPIAGPPVRRKVYSIRLVGTPSVRCPLPKAPKKPCPLCWGGFNRASGKIIYTLPSRKNDDGSFEPTTVCTLDATSFRGRSPELLPPEESGLSDACFAAIVYNGYPLPIDYCNFGQEIGLSYHEVSAVKVEFTQEIQCFCDLIPATDEETERLAEKSESKVVLEHLLTNPNAIRPPRRR